MKRTPFEATNVRPDNYNTKDFNKGDCTTRAMYYALNGSISYEDIEAEQYRLGKERGTRRNAIGTWDLVLKNRGFSWIEFSRLITREALALRLKSFENPMVTVSRGHACAIHMGKVIDTWDSRGGRCYGVLVRNADIGSVISAIEGCGVDCEEVDVPKNQMKRRYRRRRCFKMWSF